MKHTAHFFGESPLAVALLHQMQARGWSVAKGEMNDPSSLQLAEGDRLFVAGQDDGESILFLQTLVGMLPAEAKHESKIPTLLVLKHALSRRVLVEAGIPSAVSDVLDVDVLTNEDMWAERVLCALSQADRRLSQPCLQQGEWDEAFDHYPSLDRSPILYTTENRVHLVIWGMNEMAQSMARTAALVAHYPNYVRNSKLSTRITWVHPDMLRRGEDFRHMYASLFSHSSYRVTDLQGAEPKVLEIHNPELSDGMQPFVDVEWDFVQGNLAHPALRAKLSKWAESGNWQMSLALCEGTDDMLLQQAMGLPPQVQENACTVYVCQRHDTLLRTLRLNPRWSHLYAFGMVDNAFDATLPRQELARMLNAFYSPAANQLGFPYNLEPEAVRRAWYAVPSPALRDSNVCNVLTFPSKMRSVGHAESEPHTFYALSESEVKLLAEVEHNRWSVERLLAGFRPPTEKEREAIRANIQAHVEARAAGTPLPDADLKRKMKNEQAVHFDLCAYGELSVDASGRDVRDYDHELIACIPLIMEQWREMRRHARKDAES